MTLRGALGGRWRVVAAAGLGMAFGMPAIILYTLGVFYDPIAREIPLSRADFGAGLLATTVALAITVPLVGAVVDRTGVRRPVMVGALLLALALCFLAFATASRTSYIAAMALAGVLGAGASPVAYTRAVTASFDRAMGRATGATLTLVGIGSALLPVIATAAVGQFGWRGGLLCLAALALLSVPVSFAWLRPPLDREVSATVSPASPSTLDDQGRSSSFLLDVKFWLLLVGFTIVAASMFGFMVHLVPFLRKAGLGAAEAASYASLLGVSGLISRLIVGTLCDFVRPQLVMAGCVGIAAVALVLVARNPGLAALAAVALGFVIGAELDLMSILASRYYPGRLYGRVYGILYAPTIVGTGLSSLWIGAVADRQGYVDALFAGAAFGLLGGMLFLFLPKVPRAGGSAAAPASPSQ